MYDCAVIGTGPAGLSAALNLKIHNKEFIWFGSKNLSDKVSKAEQILNYPGMPNASGEDLSAAFKAHADAMGMEIIESMINQIIPNGDSYALMAGSDFYETKTIILATGIAMKNTLPGEAELLGRGVSYCATCDGGLYRGKTIAVFCGSERFEHEVKYLSELAKTVYFFPSYKNSSEIADNVVKKDVRMTEVLGDGRVDSVNLSDGSNIAVDGVFFLRDSISLAALLPGLETEDGHIKASRGMNTSLPGVFAAGDCTGRPYQYTKSVGEGNIAAHSALEYLAKIG